MHAVFRCVVVFGLVAGIATCALAQKAASPAKAPPRIKATQTAVLRDLVGQPVTAYGKVARTGKSNSGHHFLNFAQSELSVFCHKDDVARFPDDGPADRYRGQEVEVTGRLELFDSRLQIRVREPSQIKVAKERSDAPSAPGKTRPTPRVELKKIGADGWLSPAGLRYQGRDPMGLTRLDHVLRHAEDQPSRDGPHGVFDGGADGALAVIDEAWELIQRRRIEPEIESNRAAYLVSLGRRIGYLGGREGERRGHPALTRVFLVVERGTTNVVTAFPR